MLIDLNKFEAENGNLIVIDNKEFKFVRSYFIYNVPNKDIRGKHAHKSTSQILIALNGRIRVKYDCGKEQKYFLLDDPSRGLFIKPMIWDETEYLDKDSIRS